MQLKVLYKKSQVKFNLYSTNSKQKDDLNNSLNIKIHLQEEGSKNK